MTPSGTPTPAPMAVSLEDEELDEPLVLFDDGVVVGASRLDTFARTAWPGTISPSGSVNGSSPLGQVMLPSTITGVPQQ